MKKYSFKQRFSYFFDNTMSKGTIALVAWLGLFSLAVVLFSSILVSIFTLRPGEGGDLPMGFWEAMWQSVLRTLDAGTMAGDQGYGYRSVMFFVTLGGIFIISTFIGVVSSGLESKIEDLRKGRSLVIENNHVIILGWSSKVFTLISELCLANKSAGGGVIVVLADRDKVEMEDDIRNHIDNFYKTRVICRSGSPHDADDLIIVNPHISKSIIIVSSEEGNSDSQVIKSILALNNIREESQKPYHIVAEIQNQRNLEVAKMVGGDEVELVFADDITARIMVQASRQTGLSLVYSNLMDFEGVEMYFKNEKATEGKAFGDCLALYEDCAVMGVQRAKDGSVEVNPPMDYVLQSGDRLLFIAEDDDKLTLSSKRGEPVGKVIQQPANGRRPERSLLLGWNQRAKTIVTEMDNYAQQGSLLKIVSSYASAQEELDEIAASLQHVKLEFVHADTTAREVLEALDIPNFDYVLLLCYQSEMDLQDADAETLVTLLHLRRIFERAGKRTNVVSEMLDLRNCDLAQTARADDYIVSDKLISLLITQVAESKGLMRVFDSLFSAEGSEIYLKPAKYYAASGQTNFYTVVESARQRGETAIGYRLMSQASDEDKTFGIYLNPKKSETFSISDNDLIIVLAESQ